MRLREFVYNWKPTNAMYKIIFLLAVGAVFYYLIFIRKGKVSFWKIVAKNPDLFYENIRDNKAWVVEDESTDIDKSKYAGPFRLFVPSQSKTIVFYGVEGKYEESQKEIVEKMT